MRDRLTLVWLALVTATVGAWLLALEHDRHSREASAALTAGVLLLAAVKVALVIGQFMEARSGPRRLQLVCGGWLVGAFALIGALYALA